jgi:alkanesulfonate monooxygenase SsuD/methylene tetrahydromethanopterin reductase-like flavin-dependent oxidoreductase (luciferase family)
MSARRRAVALTPMETRRDVIVRTARLADRLGYEAFVLPEGWGLDSTVTLTEIALVTRQIKVVSGILSIWGRTPATLAMTSATLHQVSEGRYILGLGASTRALVQGFHGVPFTRPADRLRQVTADVRALLSGEPARLDGVPDTRPLRLGQASASEVPIWLAAMGERSVQVAAELGDGWFPTFMTRDHVAATAARLRRQAATRPEGSPAVVAGPLVLAAERPDQARDAVASCIAWYLCAMGDLYARFLSEQGYETEVKAVLAANPRPNPLHGIVPAAAEDILDQLTAYGTADRIQDRLEPWDRTVDLTAIGLPPGLPWPVIEATLHAAAP